MRRERKSTIAGEEGVGVPPHQLSRKVLRNPRPARVLQLAQRLRLDLADALAGHRELLADLFQRVVGVHADAEAHANNALLAGSQ